MPRRAYTIAELLIVIGVLLVLAAIALTSVSGIAREQKINNAINELRNELQEARQLALNARGSQALAYEFRYTFGPNASNSEYVAVLAGGSTAQRPLKQYVREGLQLIMTSFDRNGNSRVCTQNASIRFLSQTGAVEFSCDTNPQLNGQYPDVPAITQFTLNLSQPNTTRQRVLSIHRAAGTPQVAAP